MSDEIEAALRSLGSRLDIPDAPDATPGVLSRLDEPAPSRWRPVHRVAVAAAAALVALATAMALSPSVRAAVFDLLRIGGVEIHGNAPAPTTPPTDPAFPEDRDVSLAEARKSVDFPLKMPGELGEPTAVRLIDDARVVSMSFDSAQGTVQVDQFGGGLAPMFAKFAAADDIRHVTVSGTPAVWVDRPHVVLYIGPDGRMRENSARLAGSTLIWENAGRTYRVEGELTEQQAVAVAESLR